VRYELTIHFTDGRTEKMDGVTDWQATDHILRVRFGALVETCYPMRTIRVYHSKVQDEAPELRPQ